MRILVVGPGLIGKKHIQVCEVNENVSEIFVLGTGCLNGKNFCEAKGIPYFSSIDELLHTESFFDGVIVATPNSSHLDIVLKLRRASNNFLVEKPLAEDDQDFKDFIKVCRTSDLNILVGHHRLHNTLLAEVKRIIDDGRLGDIVGFSGSAAFYKPDQYFLEGDWRTKKGGGPIAINMSHEIATIEYLLGEINNVNSFRSSKSRGYEVEDTVSFIFETKKGVLGSFFLSDCSVSPFSWELTTGENPSYPNYSESCYTIFGSHGSLSVPEMKIYKQDVNQNWWKELETEVFNVARSLDPFELQFEHFLNVIKGAQQPKITVYDSYRYHQTLNKL